MGNLFFPQLTTGALAQYPVKKTNLVRTIKNILPGGSMIVSADPLGSHRIWDLVYTDLAPADMEALQAHFAACGGPLRSFTFIDPTDNMLVSSSDLTNAAWAIASEVQLVPGALDPNGGTAAVTVTNTGQAPAQISQTIAVPANYQYCFSFYGSSTQTAEIVMARSGSSAEDSVSVLIGPDWSRVTSSGRLNDAGTAFTVAVTLAPGQQVALYGLQLEAQVTPSRYRPTAQIGGVYSKAHLGNDQLTIVTEGPDLYSTAFSIETVV